MISQTFVTVLVVARNPQKEILILQRNNDRHDHPGIWNVVTGYLQDRESVEEAALRELKEETNLLGQVIQVSKPHSDIEGETNWIGITVMVDVADISSFQMDKSEAQDFRWVTPDEAGKLNEWLRTIMDLLDLI